MLNKIAFDHIRHDAIRCYFAIMPCWNFLSWSKLSHKRWHCLCMDRFDSQDQGTLQYRYINSIYIYLLCDTELYIIRTYTHARAYAMNATLFIYSTVHWVEYRMLPAFLLLRNSVSFSAVYYYLGLQKSRLTLVLFWIEEKCEHWAMSQVYSLQRVRAL